MMILPLPIELFGNLLGREVVRSRGEAS